MNDENRDLIGMILVGLMALSVVIEVIWRSL